MKFFTDENFPVRLNALLRAFDRDNEILGFLDHFERGTKDVDWIRAVGAWSVRPFIVGGDGRILRNDVERRALRESGCSFVYLASGWTQTPWNAYCVKLLTHWPKVVEMAKTTTSPAVLELSTRGRLVRKSIPG